jgi:ABC-2 type transport system ATP-binding protein
VRTALDRFGIGDRADDAAAQLSKGLRQRVALARTLLHDPAVVLLDEPTSGLDPESARDVRELVRELAADGRAVLICTHNLDEVARLANRVAILRTKLLATDTPDGLRARFFSSRVRVTVAGDAARFAALLQSAGVSDVSAGDTTLSVALSPGAAASTPDVVRLLVEAGAHIEQVTPETPSLEDAYIEVVEGAKRA